jgi:hypothetical protein
VNVVAQQFGRVVAAKVAQWIALAVGNLGRVPRAKGSQRREDVVQLTRVSVIVGSGAAAEPGSGVVDSFASSDSAAAKIVVVVVVVIVAAVGMRRLSKRQKGKKEEEETGKPTDSPRQTLSRACLLLLFCGILEYEDWRGMARDKVRTPPRL